MSEEPARLGRKVLAGVVAASALVALPLACLELRSIGPASRVVFREYLPLEELAIAGLAAVLGARLGARAVLARSAARPARPRRVGLQLERLGLALLLAWVLWPQLRAFPASAAVAAREAWARAHVPQFPALARTVSALPEVRRDVGRVVAIAPSATDAHAAAREMNGDDMRFTLEVVGERGSGTFLADCTLDEFRVYEWRSGVWRFHAHETRIASVPERVPPP